MKTMNILLSAALATSLFATGCAMTDDTQIDDEISGTTTAVTGRPYFEMWKTGSSWYFHMSGANHEIMLSSQRYSSRTAALAGVLSVIDNAGYAEQFELLLAQNGEYYFNLKAKNGEIIGTSETYSTKSNAQQGIGNVMDDVDDYLAFQASRTGARFVVSEGTDGRFYFNLRAANGAIVLQSQGYSSEAAAYNGTFSVVDNGLDPESYDINTAKNGGYYFNLFASNGQVIGTSEVYSSKFNAERARDAIIDLLPNVDLL